jgi:hypothetical protein
MTATPEQISAIGSAARELLRFAWARQPRADILVINGLIAAAKTFATDVTASAALLRQAIEPEHLRKYGYKELSWIVRQIGIIAKNDPNMAVEIYAAAYGYSESSGDSTNMGNSVLLSLTSNRRQDYEGAWFQLAEALPSLLDGNLEAGVRALARGLDGYVGRQCHSAYPGEPTSASFSLGQVTAKFKPDWSHSWYRGGFQPRQDAPVLLTKFDEYLQRIAGDNEAKDKIRRMLTTLAQESGVAAIWASLLIAGTQNPALYARLLAPLASAAPILLSSDTRYQAGAFITAAYEHLLDDERATIERAILALSGEREDRSKVALAGCIPKSLIATTEMRTYVEHAEQAGALRPNVPPIRYTSSFRAFDTDAYLESEGVSLEEPESAALRELMRNVEVLSTAAGTPDLSVRSVRSQLPALEALRKGLANRLRGNVPNTLFEHATGKLAEAASRIARAAPAVLKAPSIKVALKRILLFCAASDNPRYDAAEEKRFHESLSWGGPSARALAAEGFLNLIRADKNRDSQIMAAVHKLARDPVAHVRLQIIQNLAMLRILDPTWSWSEMEYVLAKEPTRGVVSGALTSLGRLADLDIPRAIRLAKALIRRYRKKKGAGMAHSRSSAETLIFDIHIHRDIAEADTFASALMDDVQKNSEIIKHLVARYSDNLLSGSVDKPEAADNRPRQKTLNFYRVVTERAFAEIDKRAASLDIRKFDAWPGSDQETVRQMFSILDEVSIRLRIAAGTHDEGATPAIDVSPQHPRLYREAQSLFARLAGATVASIAHNLIQALETFIPIDPPGVFALIAESVRSAEQGRYALESMAVDLIVRIVERYLADYRSVFADRARLDDLMDCLDVFVRAGWPSAQALTFRLGEIWR